MFLSGTTSALIALHRSPHPDGAHAHTTQDLLASLQPNAVHWLGTDHLGRDQLARLGEGLRTSLGLALASAGLAVALGGALGLFAAARGDGDRAPWRSRRCGGIRTEACCGCCDRRNCAGSEVGHLQRSGAHRLGGVFPPHALSHPLGPAGATSVQAAL
ncbi:MAG: hypothetical protein R3E42_04760 [Burkholderiaceae bacterium]